MGTKNSFAAQSHGFRNFHKAPPRRGSGLRREGSLPAEGDCRRNFSEEGMARKWTSSLPVTVRICVREKKGGARGRGKGR